MGEKQTEENSEFIEFFKIQVDVKPASGYTTIKIVELDSDGNFKWHRGLAYDEVKGVNFIERLLKIDEDYKIRRIAKSFKLRCAVLNSQAAKNRKYVQYRAERLKIICAEESGK
ncbi:hypothetical protein MSSAC_0955 [Methanosarcina siciliae C2J]|uniref:Uncharacterized protein n=1 Tax=Methanosarcina siciliae C2J TaxID=1434118 RepID=A0A0E3PK93_9EURY|nr:hypothetical protein [Methanosarcina siciliae]AKB35545.1 hypothetical protein MSSAC_0955 [Methanosarcina siciliae C2J]